MREKSQGGQFGFSSLEFQEVLDGSHPMIVHKGVSPCRATHSSKDTSSVSLSLGPYMVYKLSTVFKWLVGIFTLTHWQALQ